MVWFLVIALVLLFAGAYFAYKLAFYNDIREDDIYHVPDTPQYQALADEMRAGVRKMAECPYEQVFITSHDGLRLAARYYHVSDGAPVQLQIHGYRGSALRDFCGGHAMAMKMGHNCLTVDQRSHGKSEGNVITFGIQERYDCLDWIRYIHNRFGADTPVILTGVSMGAATVLMASELNLPDNVACVVADCPYSTPRAIIEKVCGDMKYPGKLLYPLAAFAALVYGHFRIWEASAVDAVKHAKVPVLIIHGEDDKFVPCEMSHEIFNANRELVKLETFPGAGHGLSYLVDTARYEKLVSDFVSQALQKMGRQDS